MAFLNENIKILRTGIGLSQVEFAAKMRVTKQCVSNWENDNVLPSVEMLMRLADFFGVSTDYLLGRETTQNIRVVNLTETQIEHLRLLIKDFEELNSK